MLEQLILNNRLQAALQYECGSRRSLRQELIECYKKGKRVQFFKYYSLLHRQFKLQFYLRVYFLIYGIHPSFGAKSKFPEEQVNAFRTYLDVQGKQITKNDQFLSFCALPFVKKPLEHRFFRTLFQKEWVGNLTQKLQRYIAEEEERMRSTQSHTSSAKGGDRQDEIEHYKSKYKQLQESQKQLISQFHKFSAESQGKWLQVTRELTQQSLRLIQMVSQTESPLMHQSRFLRIRKKVQQYERMLQKELEELMSQSQDISLFERPSIDVSYSVSYVPALDNNITGLSVDEYTPLDYNLIAHAITPLSNRIPILRGLVWRIVRSKDLMVRRMHVVSLFLTDVFEIRSGRIDLFEDSTLCHVYMRLFESVAQDLYGQRVLYQNAGYYREVVRALPILYGRLEYSTVKVALRIIEILSPQTEMTKELIGVNTVCVLVGLLRGVKSVPEDMYEGILQPILSILLNISTVPESFSHFESERDIFTLLISVFHPQNQDIRTFVMAIIYSLTCCKTIMAAAHKALHTFISRVLDNPNAQNRQQAATIMQKITSGNVQETSVLLDNEEESLDSQTYAEAFQNRDQELENIHLYIEGHELLSQKYTLFGQPAHQQIRDINDIIKQFKVNRKGKRNQNKKNSIQSNKQEGKREKQDKSKSQFVSQLKDENKIDSKKNAQKDLKAQIKLPQIKKDSHMVESKYQHRKLRGMTVAEEDQNIFKSPSFKNVFYNQSSTERIQNKIDRKVDKVENRGERIDNKVHKDEYVSEKYRAQSSKGQQQGEKKQQSSRGHRESEHQPVRKAERQAEYRIKKSASVEKKLNKRGEIPADLSLREDGEKRKEEQLERIRREEQERMQEKEKRESKEQQKLRFLLQLNDDANKKPVEKKEKDQYRIKEKNKSQDEHSLRKSLQGVKSPPRKKSREQILRSINEELKAEILPRAPVNREDKSENRSKRMNNFIEDQAFIAKPKLRRTPPQQD